MLKTIVMAKIKNLLITIQSFTASQNEGDFALRVESAINASLKY